MSLINEALKRARVEAARRDAASKGVPPSALPVYVPRRRRPWLAPLVGFLGGLAAVAMAAGAFWLVRGSAPQGDSASLPAVLPAAAVASPAIVAPPTPAAPSTQPPTGPVPPAAPPRAAPPRAAPPPAAPPPAVRAERTPAAFEPSPPAERRESAAPAAPRPTGDPDRTFLVEAQPAGGERIKLEFIVWSETRPFAQLNGKQIGPGQEVDGYELLRVERDRVQLEHRGRTFWLRVR